MAKSKAPAPTYDELKAQVKHFTHSYNGAKGANTFLRGRLKAEQQNVEDLRGVLQEAKSDMTALQKYNEELKAENSRLQRAVEANEAEIKRLKLKIELLDFNLEKARKPWWKKIF